jgi:hypothetical protein
MFTLPHFPEGMERLIDDPREEATQGRVDFGDHRIVGLALFQFAEEGVVIEARVGADLELSNLGAHVAPAVAKQFDGLALRIGTTRSKASSSQRARRTRLRTVSDQHD